MAASTPAGASSQTRQRRGAAPSLAAAVRKTAGCGLPHCLVLGRVDEGEVVAQAEVLQRGVDEAVLRRRGHGQGQATLGAQGDGVLGSRLELPLGQEQGDDPVDDGHRHLGRGRARPRIPGVPVLGHLAHEHALGAAAAVARQRHAEVAEDLDLGLVPEDLRVDEQPVHVEDGGGEPPAAGVGSLKRAAQPRWRRRWPGPRARPGAGSAR